MAGRAAGIERNATARRFVTLPPHTRGPRGSGGYCPSRYARVPRTDQPARTPPPPTLDTAREVLAIVAGNYPAGTRTDPPLPSAKPRGVCPSCGRRLAIRQGGTIHRHLARPGVAGSVCPGSGSPPRAT